MATTGTVGQAAQLKEEGNKLFVAKDYKAAYSKYSEAIALDASNAVLYANRGACSLALENFTEAATDCEKAVHLDPAYVKAWARLGTARKRSNDRQRSLAAYVAALRALSQKKHLTSAEESLKQQCDAEVNELYTENYMRRADTGSGDVPWRRAMKLQGDYLNNYVDRGLPSSGWVILRAFQMFELGIGMLKQIKVEDDPSSAGTSRYFGDTDALEHLTNGLMLDVRVSHIDDNSFFERLNMQIEFQASVTGAIFGPASVVVAQALEMLAEKGWEKVRPTLSTTVRLHIMHAWLLESMEQNNPAAALPRYDLAIEVLERGRHTWPDVPKQLRGSVFEDTFLLGLKSMRLNCYSKAYSNSQDKSKFPLETLRQDAQELIKALKAAPPLQNAEPGFFLAFSEYPRATALSTLGLYYRELARQHFTADRSRAYVHYRSAAEAYAGAANFYPQDDEYHVYYLNCAVDMFWRCGTSAKEMLEKMETIRKRAPFKQKIWEFSTLSQSLDEQLKGTAGREKTLREAIARGEYTLDSVVRLESVS